MLKYFFLFLLFSCAKTSYLFEQGVGQIGLEWNARSNEDVLADPKVKRIEKEKIELIIKAKNYFYSYFDLEPTGIYDETTFLKSEAVTYLVVASPENKIEAIKVSFPIMGSFPYLGFFNEESALKYKKEKEAQGNHTYLRKVYAYSTLNQWVFDDNILSSFFKLPDEALIELVFHELVHTVIFVKNDVSFNENLAQIISRKLLIEYLNQDHEKQSKRVMQVQKQKRLRELISLHTKELNKRYLGTTEYKKTLHNYIEQEFFPAVKALCDEQAIIKCWPLKEEWNNARFAAIGTYVSKENKILDLYSRSNKNLKEFFSWINQKYDKFNHNKKFMDLLTEEI